MTRLKLYADPNSTIFSTTPCFGSHDMFARIEKDKWELVYDINEAEVIPCTAYVDNEEFINLLDTTIRKDQILLVMNIFHNDNHMTDEWFRSSVWDRVRNLKCRTLIIHNNNYDTSDPKYIFYDIMLNRQKYYMFDMEEDFYPESKRWTSNSKREYYTFGPIDKCLTKDSKKILCLNRSAFLKQYGFSKRRIARTRLENILADNEDVYLSDPDINVFFYPNQYATGTVDIMRSGGTWYPAADLYYNTSYVSAYVESVTDATGEGKIFCASEKTYDPLLKGNFILPFSTPNFIEGLKEWYGFKFPNWIDYSYDKVTDFNKRLFLYSESVKKISQMEVETLHQHYINDRHILEHNRNRFSEIQYSGLHDKVVDSARYFGWL
jgi:hypothetical protein